MVYLLDMYMHVDARILFRGISYHWQPRCTQWGCALPHMSLIAEGMNEAYLSDMARVLYRPWGITCTVEPRLTITCYNAVSMVGPKCPPNTHNTLW